jgi:putative nucleotidyltransferase with HDIG domain
MTNNPDDFLENIGTLPPAPQVLPKLLNVLSNPDSDSSEIVTLLTFDPGLTTRVLKTCNSALFGSTSPVSDVQEAVNRLGTEAIYRMVAAVNGSSTMQLPSNGWGVDPAALWRHSVITALAAQFIARDAGQEEGSLFTAGLLHDLGKVVLAKGFKERYAAVSEESAGSASTASQAERAAFGFCHAEMGGRLLSRWKFPTAIVASVWHHHEPGGAAPFDRMGACITLANAVAHRLEEKGRSDAVPEMTSGETAALAIIGMTGERLDHYVAETEENFAFVQALCQLAA